MPKDETPELLLDRCPELRRKRQLADRLSAALAGNLPPQREGDGRKARRGRIDSLQDAVDRLALGTPPDGPG